MEDRQAAIEDSKLLTTCLELAHKQGIDTESAIKCEGENECVDCPYNFDS